jgi:hypothetical protein
MLWGRNIKVFTDHANLMRDVLGLSLDQVYQWRLLLEEYGPEIIYIKGIHNTVADAVSRLEYDFSSIEQLKASTQQKSGIKKPSVTMLDDSLKKLAQARHRLRSSRLIHQQI